MKKGIAILMALTLALALAACGGGASSSAPPAGGSTPAASGSTAAANGEVAELKFMFWGGAQEKTAVEKMVETFNTANDGRIHVSAQHVPDEYAQKLGSMVAAGDAPDIAYVPSGSCIPYAMDGTLLFVEDLLGEDKAFLDNVLPNDQWKIDGKTAFFSTAHESLMLTYNRQIFDELNIEYPPTEFDKALTWDEFVDLCKTLTVDRNGNNAKSPDFDPENVKHYGFSTSYGINNWYPLLRSMGGDIVNEDFSNTTFDSPEMIELMTKLQDLIVKEGVAPSITDVSSNPDPSEMMLTGQVAMIIDGNWSFLTYDDEGLDVGCTFLPNMGGGSYTLSAPGVTAVFANTKYPEAALEFYKYSLDAETGATELYQNGLWQPIYTEYYTDPEKIAFWAETGSRPEEFVSVVVDNIENNVCLMPTQFITDYSQIGNIVNPAIDALLRGDGEPEATLKQVQADIESAGVYQGCFNTEAH